VGATAPFRHRIVVTNSFTEPYAVRCTCGHGWDEVAVGIQHVKDARRWRYEGRQTFYDEDYYMWKHALTGHYYAWHLERYEKETLK